MRNVKERRRGATTISSKHLITIPVAELRAAGLEVGERLVARAAGPGRVILEREQMSSPASPVRSPVSTPTANSTHFATNGLIHLDAGVVIGLLDSDDAHHQAATAALAAAQHAGDRLAMAASAYAECLVGPARRGDRAVAVVQELFDRLPIEVVDLDAGSTRDAAALRARHPSLRLPDALVLATAAQQSADHLLTTDRRWPTARELGLELAITQL